MPTDPSVPDAFTTGAAWVWSGEGVWGRSPDPRPVQVRWFSLRVEVPRGGRIVLALAADSRWMLHLDGRVVARGPQKGDVAHSFFDTIVLDELAAGTHALVVRVDSYAKSFPYYAHTGPSASEMSVATLFAADGRVEDADGASVASLATPGGWQVLLDASLDFAPDPAQGSYVGYAERVDFRSLPPGLREHGAADIATGWAPATTVHRAHTPATAEDAFLPHRLHPRAIAPLRLTPAALAAVARSDGAGTARIVDGRLRVEIPARSRFTCLVDAGVVRTVIPRLEWSGGDGATVTLTWAECLFVGERKVRAAVDGCRIVGYADRLTLARAHRWWEPLQWRAGRWIEVAVETADEPLAIDALTIADCHYPLDAPRAFAASDQELDRLWEIGVRTQRCCAHETFEDCPYYEQLQYAGDTQLQALFTYAAFGERRLPLQAIRFFHWSMLPEGLTQSRYPSRPTQVIPFWSLHWVLMLSDWWRWSGDAAAIRLEARDAVRVARWFLDRRETGGLVGRLPGWCVADWSPEWCARFGGNVPGVKDGASALPNLMLIAAMEALAEVLIACGEPHDAPWLRTESARLRTLAHAAFWDESRALYRDLPSHHPLSAGTVSQLTNAWALLIGLTPVSARARSAAALADADGICRAAYFGQNWLFEAWTRAGRQDLVLRHFASYRQLARDGATTWPEDAVAGRSECHAWSNAASYHLLRTVLGVESAAPGCRRVAVRPHLDGLDHASGAFCTPRGAVDIDFRRDRAHRFVIAVPPETTVALTWEGQERELGPGRHAV